VLQLAYCQYWEWRNSLINNFSAVPYIREFGDLLLPNSLVLDMGSWEGYNGNYLAERGNRVVSVELDNEAACRGEKIKQALGRTVSNSFVIGDMLYPMFADETFDAVVTTLVLQDITPKTKAIEALMGILDLTKPGGVNLTRVYIGSEQHQRLKADKYSVFGPGELQSIYLAQGWEFIRPTFQTPGPFELNSNGSISSVAQVFARKPQ